MKAAVVERPGELVVRDIPMPQIGEYDALCELLYGAMCSGTDNHLLAGRFPWPVRYPTVLGHESIGRVVEVGRLVRHLKIGDLVTRVGMPPAEDLNVNWGGFAEYGIARDHWAMREDGLSTEEWRPFRINQILPPGSDPRAATMMITWRETLSYVTRMGLGAGARVLIMGSGGVGLAFVAHAANLGASHVAVIGNANREDLARSAGATSYFDYHSEDLPALLAREPTSQFVIDAVGKRGQVDLALPRLEPGGTIGVYGIDDYHGCIIHPNLASGTFTCYKGGYDEAETHEEVISFWQRGLLRAGLWLDLEHPYPLADIGQALEAVRKRKVVKALVRLLSCRDCDVLPD